MDIHVDGGNFYNNCPLCSKLMVFEYDEASNINGTCPECGSRTYNPLNRCVDEKRCGFKVGRIELCQECVWSSYYPLGCGHGQHRKHEYCSHGYASQHDAD